MAERFSVNPDWEVHDYRAPGVPELVSDTWWGSFAGLLELSSLRRPPADSAKERRKTLKDDTQDLPDCAVDCTVSESSLT